MLPKQTERGLSSAYLRHSDHLPSLLVLVPLTAQIPCCVVHTSHVHLEGVSHPSRNNSLDTSISCVTLIGRETPGFRTRTFSARLDRRMTF